MNLKWSEKQELVYQSAQHFGESIRNRSDGKTPWAEAGKFGLLGLCIPKIYGGMELGALETALALEGFSRGSRNTGLAFSIAAHLLACAKTLDEFGDEKLKEAFLPRLCSGEWVGANATTEAEAGSDTSRLKTMATRSGDGYCLNGLKSFVTNAPIADCFIVYATTDRTQGYQGVSAFLVETNTPGLIRGGNQEKLGPCNSPIGEVHFTDCMIPSTHRLGNEGDGGAVFKATMTWERACLFAIYLGQMDQQLEQAIEHAKNRHQFGKAIGKYQGVSHRIANMKIRLESARWLLYHACWKMDQGLDAMTEISMAKVSISESAIQSSLDCIQIFGGGGILCESGIEQGLRDAVPSTIFSGTSEIQRDLIARGLGL